MSDRRLEPLGVRDEELLVSRPLESYETRLGVDILGEVCSPVEIVGLDLARQRLAEERLASESTSDRAEAERELALLARVYGPLLDSTGKAERAYAYRTKDGWQYRAAEYVADQERFFLGKYREYLDKGQEELEANKRALRTHLEPQQGVRDNNGDWREAQDVFYAWTRRAYENDVGGEVDIPALIIAGNTKELLQALAQVKAEYGQSFPRQGFNPRPIKDLQYGYKLGTISDHAFGMAVDIEPEKNAQIPVAFWDHIVAYTGVVGLDAASRKANWKSVPEQLHRAVATMSSTFASKLTKAVAEQTAIGVTDEIALQATIAADPHLKALGRQVVKKWRQGFFALPWELVRAFYNAGLVWGASFQNAPVDLHHFELPRAKSGKQ